MITFPRTSPSFTVRSMALGALFTSIFGTLWLINGINSLQTMYALLLFALIALLSLTLLAIGLRLFTSARRISLQGQPEALRWANRYVNSATIIQLVVSFGVAPVLLLVGGGNLIFPAVVLSVGLYLLALAPLFRLKHYYIIGALLCLIPVATVLLVPTFVNIGKTPVCIINSWTATVGIVGGCTLLSSAILNLLQVNNILRTSNNVKSSKSH